MKLLAAEISFWIYFRFFDFVLAPDVRGYKIVNSTEKMQKCKYICCFTGENKQIYFACENKSVASRQRHLPPAGGEKPF